MKYLKHSMLLVMILGLTTAGCALSRPMTQREQAAAIGGVGGGASGAIIGSLVGAATTGGLFGIPLGAVAGYYVGDRMGSRYEREASASNTGTAMAATRRRYEAAEGSSSGSVEVVHFPFDGTELDRQARRKLSSLANYIDENSPENVLVKGYTDSAGSRAYNRQLSRERAQEVRNFLIEQGVDRSIISMRGLGESDPIASNNTTAGRERNRRVEVIVGDRGEMETARAD